MLLLYCYLQPVSGVPELYGGGLCMGSVQQAHPLCLMGGGDLISSDNRGFGLANCIY